LSALAAFAFACAFVLVFATCQTFLYADRAAPEITTTMASTTTSATKTTFQFYYFHLPAFVFIAGSVMKTFATASACI